MSRKGHSFGHDHTSGHTASSALTDGPDESRPLAEVSKNVHACLRIAALHRWAFFVPFCLVSGAAFILSLQFPRTYWAGTNFERRNDPILADLQMSQGVAMFSLFSTTIARDLKSAAYMTEVVDKIGLTKDFERNADGALTKESMRRRKSLALSLGRRLSLKTRRPNDQVDIIEITYTGPDPNIGRKLLDAAKEVYIKRTMDWVRQHLEGLRDYYSAEKAEALTELRAAEREHTQMRMENPHVDPQNPGAISAKLLQLEMESNDLLRRRREYQTDLDAHRQMLAALEATARSGGEGEDAEDGIRYVSPETQQMVNMIEKIEKKISMLQTTRGMTDRHPEIQELMASRRWRLIDLQALRSRDRRMTMANSVLEASGSKEMEGGPAVAQPWAAERAGLVVQISAKEAQIRDTDLSVQVNELETAQLIKAKAKVYDLQDAYADNSGRTGKARQRHSSHVHMLSKIEPAIRVNQQDKLLHWSIGEAAHGREAPIDPKARTIVLLSLLAGVIAGVVLVVLAEVLNHTYRSADQVSRSLGIPVLSAIDEIVTSQERRRLLVRRAVVTPIVLTTLLGFAGGSGSLAYLSLQEPATYRRIQEMPRAALELIASSVRPDRWSASAEAPAS